MGSTRAYLEVRGFELAKGDLWTDSDELLKARVVVIGDTVREQLFADKDPIGSTCASGATPTAWSACSRRRASRPSVRTKTIA
jgi:putative ABC transport system permease protein